MFASFALTIDLGNATMQDGPAVAIALREVADTIEQGLGLRDEGIILDPAGNAVGQWSAAPAVPPLVKPANLAEAQDLHRRGLLPPP